MRYMFQTPPDAMPDFMWAIGAALIVVVVLLEIGDYLDRKFDR